MKLDVLASYTWPTAPVALGALSVRVDDLAARLGVAVHAWEVDGLGPARGFGGRMPSGAVILLEELELAVRHQGARGPSVYVDASQLVAAGPKPLAEELLSALALCPEELAGVVDEAARWRAAELSARATQAQAARRLRG